ncbi:hypothetical protein AVEN_100529-1 [Araneus ventricosus]|uniref:Ig-like domain-containing protein n=1 Tax=Araneus ventricosus TaxID=182803 RepID=A0A4Y2JW94_ARAVE|nr:hypothetical protein AVEN_100529-1 [Araneus ventricosus]
MIEILFFYNGKLPLVSFNPLTPSEAVQGFPLTATKAGLKRFASFEGAHHRHLRLEPTGHFHAFFTGDSFFITCSAGPNSGATRLTWQAPSGKDITVSTGRVHVEAALDNPYGLELVFEDVKYEDRGTYVCSAIIDGREAKTHFVLTVYLSITFWGTPEHQVGKEGTDFMVLCNVRSDPSPIISWYVNGSLILDGRVPHIRGWTLHLESKHDRLGSYTCRAFVSHSSSSQMKDKTSISCLCGSPS